MNKDINYSISINDIYKRVNDKNKARIELYDSIASKCFAKIKTIADQEQFFCFYAVPIYNFGFPICNMKECIMYIYNKLIVKGFIPTFIPPNTLYINWMATNVPLIQNTQSLQYEPSQLKRIESGKKQYKMIKGYKPSGHLLNN